MFRVMMALCVVTAVLCGARLMGVPLTQDSVAEMAGSIRARLAGTDVAAPVGSPTEGDARTAALALAASQLGGASLERSVQMARGQIEAELTARYPGFDAHQFVDTVALPELRRYQPEFIGMIADVLAKHFTAAELVQWRAFEESALGRKVNQLGPAIYNEARQAGQELGQRVTQQAMVSRANEPRKPNVVH